MAEEVGLGAGGIATERPRLRPPAVWLRAPSAVVQMLRMTMPAPTPAEQLFAERTFDAFLFDMNGTLITSIDSANRAWTRWSRMRGFDPAYVISILHGVRTVETMQRLGVADPEAEAAWINRTEIEDTEVVEPIAGATAFLAGLPADRWAIVTSASRALAEARLARAGIAIPRVLVASDDVERGKPDRACFLLGADRLGTNPKRCLVFEDTAAGLAAADAAGSPALAITATHEHPMNIRHPAVRDYLGLAASFEAEGLRIGSRF